MCPCFGSVGSVGNDGCDDCDGSALNPAGLAVGREDMDPGAACGSNSDQRGRRQGGGGVVLAMSLRVKAGFLDADSLCLEGAVHVCIRVVVATECCGAGYQRCYD